MRGLDMIGSGQVMHGLVGSWSGHGHVWSDLIELRWHGLYTIESNRLRSSTFGSGIELERVRSGP